MEKLQYFIYDLQNDINTKNINVEEFYYDENTLVFDLYNQLLKPYIEIEYQGAKTPEELYPILCFNIIDNNNNIGINSENINEYLIDYIANIKDNLLCILPSLPIGATFAIYRKDKIIIHSNEGNHLNFPHVHVIASSGMETVIRLDSLEIYEGIELVGKEKKKIFNYLSQKRDFLIDCYKQIVEHKIMEKITIDIID